MLWKGFWISRGLVYQLCVGTNLCVNHAWDHFDAKCEMYQYECLLECVNVHTAMTMRMHSAKWWNKGIACQAYNGGKINTTLGTS